MPSANAIPSFSCGLILLRPIQKTGTEESSCLIMNEFSGDMVFMRQSNMRSEPVKPAPKCLLMTSLMV